MRRITVDEVLDAYKETGLIPARKLTIKIDDSGCFACPITAIFSKEVGGIPTSIYGGELDIFVDPRELGDYLGLDRNYIVGFICGFDDSSYPLPIGNLGIKDGWLVRKALNL